MQPQDVRALIADHFCVELDRLRDDAEFAADLGADSLDMVELSMRFEEVLDIAIGDEESEACTTVHDALSLVEAKVAISRAA